MSSSQTVTPIKPRQNGWSSDEDTTLINIVIDFLSNKKKLTDAFAEASTKLSNRSAAACNFRYTNSLKETYKATITKAKANAKKNNTKLKVHTTRKVKTPSTKDAPVTTHNELADSLLIDESKGTVANSLELENSLVTTQNELLDSPLVDKPKKFTNPLDLVTASYEHWKEMNEEITFLRLQNNNTLQLRVDELEATNFELQNEIAVYKQAMSMLQFYFHSAQNGFLESDIDNPSHSNRDTYYWGAVLGAR